MVARDFWAVAKALPYSKVLFVIVSMSLCGCQGVFVWLLRCSKWSLLCGFMVARALSCVC